MVDATSGPNPSGYRFGRSELYRLAGMYGFIAVLHASGWVLFLLYQHRLGAVHVEYLAAGALPETTAGLAGFPFVRWKFLAGVPQRIFSRGPISLIAPCLQISLGAVRQEHLPCVLEIRAGLRQL